MAISLRNGVNGTATNTTITITLPTYQLTDYIVLVISSNNANSQSFGANVTATSLGNASNRLAVWRIVPQDGSQTSFTLTVGASSVFTWWIGAYQGVDLAATVHGAGTNIGNSSTSTIEMLGVTTDYIATGNELVLSAGSVNSTATWTTTGETIFNTTTGNAALMVNGSAMTAGALSALPSNMDRGLEGTSRNESAAVIVLQTTPNGTANILTNPSFEDAAATSTGWEAEGNTVGAPAYTKVSSGAVDGLRVQQMEYAGQSGDDGKFFAIYQAPITAEPGDIFTFSIFLSGSKSSASLIIGIEGFSAGMVYISEHDTIVSSLTGTMAEYTVEYTCPANTVAVAVYIQANELAPATSITVQMDKATLTLAEPSEPPIESTRPVAAGRLSATGRPVAVGRANSLTRTEVV